MADECVYMATHGQAILHQLMFARCYIFYLVNVTKATYIL